LTALRKTNSLGFVVSTNSIKLSDGWVIVVDRFYPAEEDPAVLREFLEHRIILFKDGEGRIYAQTQGVFPPDDINNKGQDDFGSSSNKSQIEFRNNVEKHSKPGWNFKEILQ
jgi:hypothetical protein